MNVRHVQVALAATIVFPAALLMAQVNPNASNGQDAYPQNPQVMGVPGNVTSNSTVPNGMQPTSPGAVREQSSMRDSLGAPGETGQQMLDERFLRKSTEAGLAALQFGQLAVAKGSPSVKELGQRMVDDHTELNKKLAMTADSLGVMLPRKLNKADQAEYEKLNGLSGKDFDTEYVTLVAKTHWQQLHNFHMEASAAADPGLREQVAQAFITMHEHMGMIAKTATDEGIELPARPRRPNAAPPAKQ